MSPKLLMVTTRSALPPADTKPGGSGRVDRAQVRPPSLVRLMMGWKVVSCPATKPFSESANAMYSLHCANGKPFGSWVLSVTVATTRHVAAPSDVRQSCAPD